MNAVIFRSRAALTEVAFLLALVLMATSVPAQRPAGFSTGGMPGPRFGRPRPLTLAHVPLSALAAGLRLNAGQQDRIARLRQQAHRARPAAPGPPPSDQPMADEIRSVLTGPQKQALPGLLQTLRSLRAAGVLLPVYADLKLTPSQDRQIAALAPPDPKADAGREARGKVMVLLTNTQRELAEEARPFGGPPPGWPGGPPPDGF